jgi:hypothetical protein
MWESTLPHRVESHIHQRCPQHAQAMADENDMVSSRQLAWAALSSMLGHQFQCCMAVCVHTVDMHLCHANQLIS